MKKLILGLVGASALFSTQANAFDDCCWDPCGCFEVGAAALWWKACHCPFEYGRINDNKSDGSIERVLSVKPSLEWGVRVWGTYRPDNGCWFTTLDWTYVKPSDSETVSAKNSSLSIFIPENSAVNFRTIAAEKATAKIRSRYNKVNLRFGYYLHQGCDLDFYTFAGIRWVDIKHTQKVNYVSADGVSSGVPGNRKVKMEWDGAALEFGAGLEYNLGCGFNLAGYFGALAALGDQKLRVNSHIPATGTSGDELEKDLELKYSTFTSCLPGLEARLGINYTYSCGCGTLVGEVGYQIDYYFNVLSFQGAAGQFSTCENFGFAGPYASLSFCF